LIGCIIQARVNSQRLPKKILKDLDEKNNALEYVLNQLKHSKKIDQIVIAATDLNDDNIIANFAEKNNCDCYRGSEKDVLDRYFQCAKNFKFNTIVRITSDCPLIDPTAVADRIHDLEERLANLSGGRTRLLPVTKAFGPEAVEAVLAAGHSAVGENYAQEILAKDDALAGWDVAWHVIGSVQRNKVRRLAGRVAVWQTVDRPALVSEIARRAPGDRIMVQVDPLGFPGKGGCPPGAVEDLVGQALDAGLRVDGLMTVGAQGDTAATGRAFRVVADLADALGLVERSMGMTEDLEQAVASGSTLVRVGRALFGDRPPRGGR